MLEQWRVEYGDLEERHKDLERGYWQLQGQILWLFQSRHSLVGR